MLGITSFRKTYQKIHRLPGRYENGEWVEGQTETVPFLATIQPLSMDKLSPQLQGRHLSSAVKIYTQEKLAVAGEDFRNGDGVIFADEIYWVVERAAYQSGVLEHFRYTAVRVNNDVKQDDLPTAE